MKYHNKTIKEAVESGRPHQVEFLDPFGAEPIEWSDGILIGEQIICNCCGSVFEVSDILENGELLKITPAIKISYKWKTIKFVD